MANFSFAQNALPEVPCPRCHLLTPRWRNICIHCNWRFRTISGSKVKRTKRRRRQFPGRPHQPVRLAKKIG